MNFLLVVCSIFFKLSSQVYITQQDRLHFTELMNICTVIQDTIHQQAATLGIKEYNFDLRKHYGAISESFSVQCKKMHERYPHYSLYVQTSLGLFSLCNLLCKENTFALVIAVKKALETKLTVMKPLQCEIFDGGYSILLSRSDHHEREITFDRARELAAIWEKLYHPPLSTWDQRASN